MAGTVGADARAEVEDLVVEMLWRIDNGNALRGPERFAEDGCLISYHHDPASVPDSQDFTEFVRRPRALIVGSSLSRFLGQASVPELRLLPTSLS